MADSEGQMLAFLASPNQDFADLEHSEVLDDLLGGCYEGEYFYLVATDAYGLPQSDPPSIELSNHSRIVFRHDVSAEWIAVAQQSEGFVWVMGFERTDELAQSLEQKSFTELYALFEQDLITLVMVPVPSDPSTIGQE
jgi:hypothetical protein